MAKIIIALLLIASLAGIITSASTTALPGSVLYPYKIHITEKVDGLLAFTANQKAEFSEDMAETRLAELQTLFKNDTLTSTVEVQLVSAFDTASADVSFRAQALAAHGDSTDAMRIVQNFQTTVSNAVASLPADSSISTHLQTTLSSLSALSGTIATTTIKK